MSSGRLFASLFFFLELAACTSSPPPPAEAVDNVPAPPVASSPAPISSVREPASPPQASCPPEMVLVAGSYCPNVRQDCLRYLDPPGRYGTLRCAEFKQPATCIGERQPSRYCIDREEFTDPGEAKPRVKVSWTRASELCIDRGARLCLEREWQFACEGEEMRPYPYGFARDATACNIDQTKLGRPEEGLSDLRAPVTDYPHCTSPFGVHDLTGNVDEWTERADAAAPGRSVLHGGWWLPARNSCRATTFHHNESYFAPQVGFRCCKGAEG